MQTIDGRLIYSASDLNNYLECAHLTTLDGRVLREGLLRPEPSASTKLISQKGADHEARYLQKLRDGGSVVFELPSTQDRTIAALQAAAAATEAAMAGGAQIIYQASFFDGTFLGRSDFLVRVERPCAKWAWSYEVLDTKLALHSKPYFVIQLCHYSEQLEAVQGLAPKFMHVVLGNDKPEALVVSEFDAYYRQLKRSFLRDAQQTNGTYPLPVDHCKVCSWSPACEQQRRDDDSLTLVAWMRNEQVARFKKAGISTLAALAQARDAQRPYGMNPATFGRLREQASLQYEQRETGKRKYKLLEPPAWTGFGLMPEPAPGDVFFDMEGDPLFEIGTGLEYLFGCWMPDDEQTYKHFWALSRAEEKLAFEQFVDFIVERRRFFPTCHVYHYAPYEKVALEKLAQRHFTREAEVDELLRAEVFVDLYAVVRQSLMISQESYSIKKLEPYYAFKRATGVQKGDDSIVQFEQWLLDRSKSAILEDIRDYNRDDCESTYLLREWLLERRVESQQMRNMELPFRPLKTAQEACHPSVMEGCVKCAKRERERREEERTTDAQRRLLAGISAPLDAVEFAAMPEAERGRYLLANLLAYHRREDKPVYWEFYNRCGNPDTLIEFDKNCLGGLVLCSDEEPYKLGPRDHNLVYTYSFPDQLYDLSGADLYDPLRPKKVVGTLVKIDEDRNRIDVKVGGEYKDTPELVTALVPRSHVDAGPQKAALTRIGQEYLEGKYAGESALRDVLFANAPRLTDRAPGSVIQPAQVDAPAILEVVRKLDASVLFIQGPPGTGKSTKASEVIVRLLAEGKRVGVMSNSHKAIHALDRKVEDAAKALGISFRGVHKHSTTNEGSEYESAIGLIKPEKDAPAIEQGDCQFISGNAWLFARDGMIGKLDYLFIDEAGQISLADAVAVAPCARNIIVIGDPLQLAQVSQGTHPYGVGLSVLEHLLGNAHTVPEDRGIFLNVTYRLHPSICTFISETIYDGRLTPGPDTGRQRIGEGPALGSGLRYIPIAHEGNNRESREEAERVVELACELLNQSLVDEYGRERKATASDVIILAPYNAQRRLIRKLLDARGCAVGVGTVDKFQGQEAFAVIYSMATSSDADAPRGLDFLFDKNRFNVAVSRARALPVVLCSGKLVVSRAHKLDQIRLISLFCRYVELAGRQLAPDGSRRLHDAEVLGPLAGERRPL